MNATLVQIYCCIQTASACWGLFNWILMMDIILLKLLQMCLISVLLYVWNSVPWCLLFTHNNVQKCVIWWHFGDSETSCNEKPCHDLPLYLLKYLTKYTHDKRIVRNDKGHPIISAPLRLLALLAKCESIRVHATAL